MIGGNVLVVLVHRTGRLFARLGGQLRQIQLGLGQASGEVGLHGFAGRGDLGLDVTQIQQHGGHLLGRVGGHPGFLDRVDDHVVVAHQAGASGPPDQRVRQADPLRPGRLGLPPGHHRVQGRLRLAVGAVTAEHAAVRRTGQHDMQPGRDVAVGADVRQARDEPLHGPQQNLHLHLRARTGLGQVTADARRGEREQQCRGQGVLDVDGLGPEALGLLGADPFDQRVDVVVGGHVRRQNPQLGAEPGVVAIERAVEREPAVVQAGSGRDDGGAAVEQLSHHRGRDGPLRCAGHHSHLVAVATLARILRTRGSARVERGVDVAAGGQRLALPVGGLGADHMAGALEALRQVRPLCVDVVLVHQPDPDQILTGTGPSVVEEHGLAPVERRRHQARPVRSEFGGHQVDELRIG